MTTKDKRIVVTGISLMSPHGMQDISPARLGEEGERVSLANGTTLYSLRGVDATKHVPIRLQRKLDQFVIFGMSAADQCFKDSALLSSSIDKADIGLFIGNCLGGWGYTEPQLAALHAGGIKDMNPYVATAWFPAALQGQISLVHGIKGFSKTFSSRNVAGIQAMGHAISALKRGRVKAALCGASEAVDTPYMHAVLGHTINKTFNNDALTHEQPHDCAEGAAFFMLETLEHAQARGAKIYCEISGVNEGFCPDAESVPTVMHRMLENAVSKTRDQALLVKDGMLAEENAWLNTAREGLPCALTDVDTKPGYGHMFALSGVFEAVVAARHLGQNSLTAGVFESGREDDKTCYSSVVIQRMNPCGGISAVTLTSH